MADLVSVVIPVYNQEAYLERCVESVLGQSYTNLQIILINDGSQDKSGELCDAYGAKHLGIDVIHQTNGGLSAARNAGIERAKGRWIAFIDSDDYVSAHYIQHMLDACILHGADICVCKYITDNSGNLTENEFAKTDEFEVITGREATLRHFGKDAGLLNMAWCKLMRASLWKELRFPVGKINEDVFVSHYLFYSARNVVITDSYLYAYYQSPGSIMRNPFTLKRLDVLCGWYEGIRFFEQAYEPKLADIARRVYLNRLFDAYGLCKKFLPKERDIHKRLRRQAIDMYKSIRHVRSYIDIPKRHLFLHRAKQFVGRYYPGLYSILFLRRRTYI